MGRSLSRSTPVRIVKTLSDDPVENKQTNERAKRNCRHLKTISLTTWRRSDECAHCCKETRSCSSVAKKEGNLWFFRCPQLSSTALDI